MWLTRIGYVVVVVVQQPSCARVKFRLHACATYERELRKWHSARRFVNHELRSFKFKKSQKQWNRTSTTTTPKIRCKCTVKTIRTSITLTEQNMCTISMNIIQNFPFHKTWIWKIEQYLSAGVCVCDSFECVPRSAKCMTFVVNGKRQHTILPRVAWRTIALCIIIYARWVGHTQLSRTAKPIYWKWVGHKINTRKRTIRCVYVFRKALIRQY